jgi:feruloyl esterase
MSTASYARKITGMAAIGAVCLTVASQAALAANDAKAGKCPALASLELPEVRISSAVAVPAASSGQVTAAHCRVDGAVGKEIRFQLLLPEQWNGKFFMGGGGGFVGSVQNQSIAVVNAGFATVGTDTGHQGSLTQANWALNDLERQLNYAHVGVHRVAEVSKAIVREFYGAKPQRSYFGGCSNGGRQAMMSAQRYPADFDGIVAGAPAIEFTALGAQFIKDMQAQYPDPKNLEQPLITPASLTLLATKMAEACDRLDGVKDGIMEDPRTCKFDLGSLPACAGDRPGEQCVTQAQSSALRKIYAPTQANGETIYSGQPFGGEADAGGWETWITGANPQLMAAQRAPNLRYVFGTELFKYFIYADPNWDYSHYDLGRYRQDAARVSAYLNASDPNLDAFKSRGGKLIIWHGWSDPALSALASVKYYEQVRARDPAARDYARLFLLPGVLHCAGGPGPDTVDWTTAIVDWVESGKAPDRLIASKLSGGTATRTRPLCPYPQRAVYSGKGSTDKAEQFRCAE